jgi:enoyl-CoA hydratase
VYENIVVNRYESHAVITIDRPRALNALSHDTLVEIDGALADLGADAEIRAIIVTGAGERAFVSGADIGELETLETASEGEAHSRSAHEVIFRMQSLSKPVIMAVNGYALGGGCELALGGDIILASENASFGQPEVNLGIIPGFGGTQRLPRLVGRTKALEMIFTGARISADGALRIGLVNEVVPLADLMQRARQLALTIAEKAPLAIANAKRAVYEGLELSPRQGNLLESRYFGESVGTADRREGTSAFLEKRKPSWKGT